MRPKHILKRNEEKEQFDIGRIVNAIKLTQKANGELDNDLAEELADVVLEQLDNVCDDEVASVEEIQDMVIQVLQESGNYQLAQSYIRYRDARERERRVRWANRKQKSVEPNMLIVGRDARIRPWDRDCLRTSLMGKYELSAKIADDVVRRVELFLSDCNADTLSSQVLSSFVDTALCQCGAHTSAQKHADLRVDKGCIDDLVRESNNGREVRDLAAAKVLSQWSLIEHYPTEVLRLYSCGRLWIDGMHDPLRGSQFTSNFAGRQDPWEVISRAFSVAVNARKYWRDVDLILPPMILGHLEREDSGLIEALESLGHIARVYLYCDGRTPLLDAWPTQSKRIGLATYEDDFLLQGKLQELGLPMLTGAYLNQEAYRRRVAVRLAINAQGLENNHNRLDQLAMALVSAVRIRLKQLTENPESAGGEIRFSIFGLPPSSSSNQYLERQVIQEGLREGLALSRSANLSYEACEHLARLFE